MIANYHTHTFRCKHARGTDREYIEQAIKAGFQILGFSDHTPFPKPGDGTGMKPEELAGYVEDILQLKEEYKEQIEIYVGLEVENSPRQFGELMKMLKAYPLDYLILGQHTIFGVPDYKKPYNMTTNPLHFEMYCSQAEEGIRSDLFTYWAHPDVINFHGDDVLYEKEMRRLCRLAKEYQLPLEINFHGARLDLNYPNPKFWQIAGEEGNEVIYACDAHDPIELYDLQKAMGIAEKLVETYHLKLLDTVSLKKP